ncbi:unnamed protein product [Rhizophagus irregularis]|uniref:Uncharacterized protein n=1 Tax=Rhizophagus irregularis TaxID=588596 RepID=A0A916E8X7_9GLOM|nr:unnamed protein product [Rhizophagus irregularis]
MLHNYIRDIKKTDRHSFRRGLYINLDEFDEPLNFDPFTAETNLNAEDDTESEIAVFTRDTKINDVRHSLVPIEYPETSEEGVAYIYHIENWEDPKAAFRDIQYSLCDGSSGSPNVGCPFFGKDMDDLENKKWVQVKKAIKHCGGIKTCQLAGPNILEASHTKVDLETNPFICEDGYNNTPENRITRVLTRTEYLTAIKTRCPYPNNNFTCGVHTTNQWSEFIGCDKWKPNEKGHMSLQIKAGVDINLLKSLFANQGKILDQEDDTNCNMLYPTGCHKKYCVHLFQGLTQKLELKRLPCSVEFKMLTPLNLQRFSFVILISKGIHTHPPPPLSKTSTCIKSELRKLIENSKEQLINITAQQLVSG